MLTLRRVESKFSPPMLLKTTKFVLLVLGLIVLQSCYTVLHPPATLPTTVTSITTTTSGASSLGGTSYYGWDPYWEPALPFTSYHRGYGESYYSPYNYYDYRDPYYTPIYIESEPAEPVTGRAFGRDDRQGGSRDRNQNSINMSSGSSSNSNGVSSGGSMATPAPVISPPVALPPPAKIMPVKPVKKTPRNTINERREVKPIRKTKVPPPPRKREAKASTEKEETPKRTRTRN